MGITVNRQVIKKHLIRGDIKDIADQLGFSPDYVSLVLKGERTNLSVLEALVARSESNKQTKELLANRSNNL